MLASLCPHLLACLAVGAPPLMAQVRQPGRPASEAAILPADLPLVVLPQPDVALDLAEHPRVPGEIGGPYRFGVEIPVSLDAQSVGRWDQVAGGGALVWRLEIASPGATALSVLFDEFALPETGRVFLYTPGRQDVLGAYTAANEKPNGMLAVQPLPGDRLVIEYVQEPWVDEVPRLRVGQVVHAYRDILADLEAGSTIAMSCIKDIRCPLGNPYQDVKRSVMMVLMGGGQCSAGLLNNTAEDGTPFLLTAEHCGNLTNVVAVFNYERTACGAGPSSTSQTVSGAVRLAASKTWDSQLYRLSAIPASYQPFYAGWSRARRPKGPSASISHPVGLPKAIAIDDQDPGLGKTQFSAQSFFEVQWDRGMIDFGSSGSPLFSRSKRVIGPLCCGSGFACGRQVMYYGRFWGFWGPVLASNLDPLGTGANGIDGYDPFHPQAIVYRGSGQNPDVYRSTSPPAIGTTWTARVDASGHAGALCTLIQANAARTNGVLRPWGELLIDVTSPLHFRSIAPVVGGISTHSVPVPDDLSLAGVLSYTQAVILGGGPRVTNAIKLRLNAP